MKFTPFQLTALALAGFGTIILLNILAQYRSDESFREHLTSMSAADFIPMRKLRVAQENMEAVAVGVEDSEEIEDDEDE